MSSTSRKRYIVDFHEGLHHFIHSGDLVIHNGRKHDSYVGFGNCLYNIKARLKDISNREDALLYHIGRGDYCIAVIDREKKRICISDRHYHTYYLKQAVPDDWEVTYVNGSVKAFYLLGKSNNYAFCKAVCEWIVNKFCDTYGEEYAVLYKHKQTINKDICIPAIGNEYKETIKLLLDKYHLAECWFYKEESITDNVYVDYYQGWRKKFFNLTKVPTIEEIYENKVFSKDEQTYIIQRKFYTDFCRGCGVSFKDVVEHWEDKDGMAVLMPVLVNKYEHLKPNWKEAIIANARQQDACGENFVIRSNAESKENRDKAILAHIAANTGIKDLLTAWRENGIKVPFTVTYKSYKVTNHPSKGRYVCARWVDKKETIYNLPFKYIQLKYDADKEIITTSKGAKVRLNDAILLWKLYKQTLKSGNIETHSPHNDFIAMHLADKNIKCGIYNVTGIYRNLKRHDATNAPYYEWNVVIVCHTIWIDDFINFVEYYKLQKYFPN